MVLHALLKLLILAVAVFLVARIVPGVRLRGFKAALVVSAVYSALNFVLFRVLIVFTFPFVVLKWVTLGLFGVVLNAILLMITDRLVDDFELDGFGSALLAAIGISVVNLLLSVFV